MQRSTTYKSRDDKTVILQDGTIWAVTDINAAVNLPMWMAGDQIESEDFGIDSYIKNLRRNETLKAKKLAT